MALAAHMHARAFRASCQRPSAPTRHRRLSVMAFKETQPIHDWRTQKMIDVAHTYYHTVWSKPDAKAAISQVIDDGIVFRDNVWRAAPMVGSRAFSEHVADLRRQYPDMYYEVEEFGLQDPTHLFVLWRCHETQLESRQGPASLHSSVFSGVDILAFNHERTKVVEVSQFRQPNWEERKEHEPRHDSSPYEIKLARLHVTPMHE